MSKNARLIKLMVLGMSFSMVYGLPYIHFKFYDAVRAALQTSHEELGFLMTILTASFMLLYIPGGLIADRFSPRKILPLSVLAAAGLNVALAFSTSYTAAQVIWALAPISCGFAYWGMILKVVRELGSSEEQGKMFGLFFGFTGLFSTCLGVGGSTLFAAFENPIQALHYVLLMQAGIAFVCAILLYVLVEDKAPVRSTETTSFKESVRSVIALMMSPSVWLMILLIFCGYGMYIGVGYMTPYTTNILGVSLAFGGILGTIRSYGIRFFTGPFSGYISDKIGSRSLTTMGSFTVLVGMIFVLLSLPEGTSTTVLIAMTLMFSFFALVIYSIMYACMDEVNIPKEHTGLAGGLIGMLGYLPDAVFPPLFGSWLDAQGNDAYNTIFYFLAGLSIFGIFVCFAIFRKSRAQSSATALEAEQTKNLVEDPA